MISDGAARAAYRRRTRCARWHSRPQRCLQALQRAAQRQFKVGASSRSARSIATGSRTRLPTKNGAPQGGACRAWKGSSRARRSRRSPAERAFALLAPAHWGRCCCSHSSRCNSNNSVLVFGRARAIELLQSNLGEEALRGAVSPAIARSTPQSARTYASLSSKPFRYVNRKAEPASRGMRTSPSGKSSQRCHALNGQ